MNFKYVIVLFAGKTNYRIGISMNFSFPRLIEELVGNDDIKIHFFNQARERKKINNLTFLKLNYTNLLRVIGGLYFKKNILILVQGEGYEKYGLILKRILNAKLVFRRGGIFFGKSYINSPEFKSDYFRYKHIEKADLFVSTADGIP